MTGLAVEATTIDGLFFVELKVNGDERGSFTEVYQAEKIEALGLPPLGPVQWNRSVSQFGTLRGIHAEPWEKFVSVMYGEAFAAWVDLRPESPTAGQTETWTLNQHRAVFITRGIGNSFQALADPTVYCYLVNDHWSADAKYSAVAWDDPDLGIDWPITDERLILSDKDRNDNPTLKEVLQ